MTTDKKQTNNHKIIIVYMAVFIVILLSFIAFPSLLQKTVSLLKNPLMIISPDEARKNELREFYNQIIQYNKDENYTALYDFLTPKEKEEITLDDYIQENQNLKKSYNLEYSVDNIEVNGDVGVITRTVSYCETEGCSDSDRLSNTSKKKYEYIEGKWYYELDNTLYCARQEAYTIPQEFERGFSLIIQRLEQSDDIVAVKNSKRFSKIKNCLDIQYASSDNEMYGAEGVFMFSSNSSQDRLKILVSPRYQAKDDLLTAVLLSHEISHAFIFATGSQNNVSCYKNEAIAFREQMRFLINLNMEEIASLTYRYNNNTSEEAVSVINLIVNLRNSPGDTPEEKSLNYVMNSTFYQKQCGE